MKATCLSRFEKPFAKVLNLPVFFPITYCMVFLGFFYLQLINPVLQPLLWLDFEELHLFQEVLALPRWLLFKLSATCLQLSRRDTPQLLRQKRVSSLTSIFSKAFGTVLLYSSTLPLPKSVDLYIFYHTNILRKAANSLFKFNILWVSMQDLGF